MRTPRSMMLLAALSAPTWAAPGGLQLHREEQMLNSHAFLHAHPDLKHRRAALAAYDAGDHAQAAKDFRRAARFADKPSQAMLAEMLWRGEGLPRDRAAAWAWMDLAAERGFAFMRAKRESYWTAMDAAERERAQALGKALQAEFGDAAAKPRLEWKLRRAKYERTGSNAGFVGPLTVTLNVDNEPVRVQGAAYYEARYWEPEKYWKLQDAEWQRPRRGRVDVGPLRAPAQE